MEYIVEIIKYIIIGFVQGITEILPISSSGHLIVFYKLLSINEESQLNLTVFLHLSSSIALCCFFKDILLNIIKGSLNFIKTRTQKEDFLLLLYVVISSVPIAVTGIFIKPFIEKTFNNSVALSFGFFISSIILLLNKKLKLNNEKNYNIKNTLIVGLFQCISVFPGISRSGITLFASKISKLNSKDGRQFAFLLLVPISFGSSLISIIDVGNNVLNSHSNLLLYTISMIVAFIFTYLSLKFFFSKNIEKFYYHFTFYLLFLSYLTLTLL